MIFRLSSTGIDPDSRSNLALKSGDRLSAQRATSNNRSFELEFGVCTGIFVRIDVSYITPCVSNPSDRADRILDCFIFMYSLADEFLMFGSAVSFR